MRQQEIKDNIHYDFIKFEEVMDTMSAGDSLIVAPFSFSTSRQVQAAANGSISIFVQEEKDNVIVSVLFKKQKEKKSLSTWR